ncbi:MAG TPA: AI-2E family transporter [Mycobacteriales bacterium]|nr:AI-2E family transporter [Mycobacteriales bacterium]
MDRSTRASDAAPPPSDDAARPGDSDRPADTPPSESDTPRDTAESAAAEEANTTGLTGAPDPATDSAEQAAARDRAQWEEARRQQGRLARVRSIDAAVVPPGVRAAAAWAWRILAILLAAYVVLIAISRIRVVVIPLAIALLLAALLQPLAAALAKRGLRPALATAITLLSGLVGIGLLVWLVEEQFRNGLGDLTTQINGGIDKIQDWLINGPLGLSQQQINDYVDSARRSVADNRSRLTTGALGAAGTIGEILTGALLTLFATVFFIKDGRHIWTWIVRLFPRGSRERIAGAGERAWRTLISYVHATLAVAFVDAVGIGTGAAILGVPLALPLAVIVFLFSFIPIIGATLSGLIAVLIALVAKGPVTALILLGVVLLVQQVEGHILQPLLLGRAVKVHPLAIVFGIATGTLLAGIIGALLAVPIVAVIATVSGYLSKGDTEAVPVEPADEQTPGDTAPAG